MVRLYIDYQTMRDRWRLRVMTNGGEALAVYCLSKKEAEKHRRLLRKMLQVKDSFSSRST